MFEKRCFSWALATSGSQTTSATKYGLEILFILKSIGGGVNRSGNPCSGAALGQRIRSLLLAVPAVDDAAKRADDADECPAIHAGITFRGTLLVPAGAADHRIAFTEDLAHLSIWFVAVRVGKEAGAAP